MVGKASHHGNVSIPTIPTHHGWAIRRLQGLSPMENYGELDEGKHTVSPKKIPKRKIAIKHSSTFLGLLYRNIEDPRRSRECRSDFILQPTQVTSMLST